jgi:hypothetical protein
VVASFPPLKCHCAVALFPVNMHDLDFTVGGASLCSAQRKNRALILSWWSLLSRPPVIFTLKDNMLLTTPIWKQFIRHEPSSPLTILYGSQSGAPFRSHASLRSDLNPSNDPHAFYSMSSVIFSLVKLGFIYFDNYSVTVKKLVRPGPCTWS